MYTHVQLSKMTEKVQKMSKQLSAEKAASEQLQKASSDQKSQLTSENRKLALEISKLKVICVIYSNFIISQFTSLTARLSACKQPITHTHDTG